MDRQKQIKYINRCCSLLPYQYTAEDLNHLALVNFTLSSLDLLDSLPDAEACKRHIEWIYHHYVPSRRGFRGSLNAQLPCRTNKYDPAHLPATYFAIMSLVILGDDLSRLDCCEVMLELCDLQQSEGSFRSSRLDLATDVRFSYMAVAIRHLIHSLAPKHDKDIDTRATLAYLARCQNSDGGYGQRPGAESHSGFTFCALAARLLLKDDLTEQLTTINWLVHRQNQQDGGFGGRVGKDSDVCYVFWNISSLALLDAVTLVDADAALAFLGACETMIGGYGKSVGDMPDIFHSYLGISVQSLLHCDKQIKEYCALSISERALNQLRRHRSSLN